MKTSQVFVSQTSDMALFPKHRPFVQAVFDAVGRVGMAPIDMRYFPARDDSPADYCRQRVSACETYIAVVGFRYGSPVPGLAVSYTELEFQTASVVGLPRLVFLLEESALPPGDLADTERHAIDGFRQRLRGAGLMVRSFISDDSLELEVFHALSELASGFSSAQPTVSSGRWRPEAGLRLQELAVSGRSASPHGHPGTATRFHETVPRVWNVPSKNADFTGRDAILDRLHGDLAGDRKAVVTERDTGWAVSARPRWRSSTRTASKMTTTWSGGSPQSSLKRSAWPWPIWPPSCVPGEDRRRLPGTAARIGWISGAEEHVVEPAR